MAVRREDTPSNLSEPGTLTKDFPQETQCQTAPPCYTSTNLINVSRGSNSWQASKRTNSRVCGDILSDFDTWLAGEAANSHVHREDSCTYNKFSIKDEEQWTNMSFGNLLALADAVGKKAAKEKALTHNSFVTSSTSASCFHPQMEDGSSIPSRYFFDLNSPPRTITDAALRKSMSSQFEPITPEKTNKAEYRHEFAMKNLNIDEAPAGKENEITRDGVMELHEKKEKSHLIIDQLREATSTQLQEDHKPDKGGTEEANLSKTPQQKTRKKKHRPKVIIEGQHKRTPKSSAEKTSVPQETTRVKRKYVRRKVVYNSLGEGTNGTDLDNKAPSSRETPVGKRKYARKGINIPEGNVDKGTTETTDIKPPRHTRRSCRRSLNFNSDGQVRDGSSSYFPSSNCERESQEENFNTKDQPRTVHCTQEMEVMMKKNDMVTSLQLTHTMNQVWEDYLSRPEQHSQSPLPSTNKDTLKDNHILTDQIVCTRGKCQIVFSDVTHDKEANTVQVSMNPVGQWTPKCPSDSICRSTCLTPEKQVRGLKRQNMDTTVEAELCNRIETGTFYNSLQAYLPIFSQNADKNDGTPGLHFPVIYKKKRTEKGHSMLTSSMQITASTSDSHVKLKRHTLRDSCTKLFASPTNQGSCGAQCQDTNLLMINHVTASSQNGRQVFEDLLALGPTQTIKKRRSKGPTRLRDLASLLEICKEQPATPGRLATTSRIKQHIEISHEPHTCMEALVADPHSTMTTKKQSKRNVLINSTVQNLYNHQKFASTSMGDRHFSPRKRSVVDSVVGVFLTQNVSDHLSSSAFMSLAAQFPLKSKIHPAKLLEERLGTKINEPEVYVLDSDGAFELNKEILNQSVYSEEFKLLQDFEDNSIRQVNSIKSSGNTFNEFILKGSIRGQSTDTSTHGPVMSCEIVANKPVSLIEDERDTEDTLSCQTPEISSQSSADSPIAQTTKRSDSCLLSSSEEEPTAGVKPNRFAICISFIKNLQMAGTVSNGVYEEGSDKEKPDENQHVRSESLASSLQNERHLDNPTFPAKTIASCSQATLCHVPNSGAQAIEFDLSQKNSKFSDSSSYKELCGAEISELSSESASGTTFQKITAVSFEEVQKFSSPNAHSSSFASARLALPAPQGKSIMSAIENRKTDQNPIRSMDTLQLPSRQANEMDPKSGVSNSQPIIEEPPTPEHIIELPATPEPDYTQVPECDIKSVFNKDSDEVPTIQLNMEEFTHNLQKIMQQNTELQEGDMSKALVTLTSEAASIPVPKLKNVRRLRTEHQVYELPDSHPPLGGVSHIVPDNKYSSSSCICLTQVHRDIQAECHRVGLLDAVLNPRAILPFEGKLNFSALKARREAARAGGGSKGEWEASCRERKPIGKGKKKADRDLPPPLPNRLANAGRDCQGGRASRLDEGFPPTGDRRMSPRASGGSRAEQTVIALNCGLKRPRDDLPPPTSRPSWSFSGSGVNRSEGVESFWDEEDGGLAWKKSRALLSSYDLSHLEESSDRVVAEAMAGGCIQLLNMSALMEGRVKEYKDSADRAEHELKKMKEEDANLRELVKTLKDEIQKVQGEKKELKEKLALECSSGETFLASEAGRRHVVSLVRKAAKSAVNDFIESSAFEDLCMEHAMSAYDDVVKECQVALRDSRHASEDGHEAHAV